MKLLLIWSLLTLIRWSVENLWLPTVRIWRSFCLVQLTVYCPRLSTLQGGVKNKRDRRRGGHKAVSRTYLAVEDGLAPGPSRDPLAVLAGEHGAEKRNTDKPSGIIQC